MSRYRHLVSVNRRIHTIAVVIILLYTATRAAQAAFIDTVPIGNAGNSADGTSAFGSVVYPFRMGQTEITNAQYVELLNAVAASDV